MNHNLAPGCNHTKTSSFYVQCNTVTSYGKHSSCESHTFDTLVVCYNITDRDVKITTACGTLKRNVMV